MNYKVRMYKKEDKAQIFQLIEDVWGKNKAEDSKKRWDWEFENNPNNLSQDPTIFVLESDDKIVGIESAIPVYLKVKDKVVPALWLVDYMIHPNHRGRGGFLLLDHWISEKPYLFLGIPNAIAYATAKITKWFDICQLLTLVKIINFRNVFKNRYKNNIVAVIAGVFLKMVSEMISIINHPLKNNDISFSRVYTFDEQIDAFWKDVSKDYDIIVVRDRRYLTWRFINHSADREYYIYLARRNDKICGYVVFRYCEINGLRQGYIVDILTKQDDRETLQTLIREAVELLKSKNVDLITCLISPYNKIYQAALRKYGFIFKKYSYRVMGYNHLPSMSGTDLSNSKNWFLSMADSDLDMIR